MKFGLVVTGHYSDEVSPNENFETVLEHVRAARDAGFDLLWAGQHYLIEDSQRFQPVPLLARAAPDAGEMYLGANVLLPLLHPVDVAEQFATLDALSSGRAILGPVAGYRDREFQAFGVQKTQRAGRLAEGVELIRRLWTEDRVSHHGSHFDVTDLTITPKPVQEPRPPIWIGANSDRAVRRAAELGDAWLVNPHDTDEVITRQLGSIDPPTGAGWRGRLPVIKDAFVSETDERARQICRPHIEDFYDWYEQEGQHEAMETPEAIDVAETGMGRMVIGGPQTVADNLVHMHREWSADCVILYMRKEGIPNEEVLRSIKLFGEEVIPAIRERVE